MCAAVLDHARWTQADVVLLDIGTSAQSLLVLLRQITITAPTRRICNTRNFCNMQVSPLRGLATESLGALQT
jgi:DNA-binding NarL/FixJ family response regulator